MPIKPAAAALNQTPIDWTNNVKNIIEAIALAKNEGANLLLTPEMSITGYGCEDLFAADWLYEKALTVIVNEIAPQATDILVFVGLPMKWNNQCYNCLAGVLNGKLLGITAKQYLANGGVYYEPRWFKAWEAGKLESIEIQGDTIPFGEVVYEYQKQKIGIEICQDAWEKLNRPAYSYAKKGVDLLLIANASHFCFQKYTNRELLVQEAADLGLDTIYVNLLGNEAGTLIFDGDIIYAKAYEIVSYTHERFSFQQVEVATFNSDLASKNADLSKEEEFRKAGALALWDYCRKSNSKGYVLSLSGGADSSCCAVLVAEMVKEAVEALGEEAVYKALRFNPELPLIQQALVTAYQGTENSSTDTYLSAKGLAENIGATFYRWEIGDSVKEVTTAIESVLGRPLTWQTDDIALQNVQARARSPFIWMLTNISGGLLITTSNRSEGDVGYATMDGDMSGSIAPIAGVDKEFVRHWLLWAEKELGYFGLHRVNNLAPSAELRPLEMTQTDEADLMPYPLLRDIEYQAIKLGKSPLEVYSSLSSTNTANQELLKKSITKFFTLWSRNQWKRERMAPSFNFDDFNVSPRSWYRFPILSGSYLSELKELNAYGT